MQQTTLIKTTPQSLQKISTALAITEKLLQEDNPLGLPDLIPYYQNINVNKNATL